MAFIHARQFFHENFGQTKKMHPDQQTEDRISGLFTTAFHRDFFIPFIIKTLNTRKIETRTHFADHFPFEYVVMFIITMTGVVTGIYAYLSDGSVFGGITGLLASAGFAALIIFSIRSRSDRNMRWSRFMISTFMFFMLAGMSSGLFTGMMIWNHWLAKSFLGLVGLSAGYITVIAAGFYMQCLGWTGQILNIILIPVMIGLIIVDIILMII
jgi:hypothetical protein